MKLYHWDKNSRKFSGETDARLDPEETRLAIERAIAANPTAAAVPVMLDKWLIPANTTTEPPPEPQDEQHDVCFRDGWVQELKQEFVPQSPEVKAAQLKMNAQTMLAATDSAVLALYENKEPVPKPLVEYRNALRKLIADPGKFDELPVKPEGF